MAMIFTRWQLTSHLCEPGSPPPGRAGPQGGNDTVPLNISLLADHNIPDICPAEWLPGKNKKNKLKSAQKL